MPRRPAIVLGLFLLLLVPLVLVPAWRQSRAGGARPVGEATSERAAESAELVAPEEPTAIPEVVHDETLGAAERAELIPATESSSPPTSATLRGRFVLENGAPAIGVTLKLHGWPGNRDGELKYGLPESWEDLAVTSAKDGSFALAFEPPGAFQFTLDAKVPGHAGVGWRWTALRPGASLDLGEIVLRRGGTLLVAIVDATGRRLTEDWRIYAHPAPARGPEPARVYSRRPEPDGTFRLEDVAPGDVGLQANSSIAGWVHGPTVVVRAGEETVAEIRYAGPDNAVRITVTTSCPPFNAFAVSDPASIQLHGAGLAPRTAQTIPGSQKHSFDGVGSGAYRLTIDDPRFLPWSREGVEPGSHVSARLVGSCRLALRVVDGASEEPVSTYTARLRFRNVSFHPREHDLAELGTPPSADGVFAGIVPGDFTLVVVTSDDGIGEVDIDALAPGEERAVLVRLVPGGTLAGALLQADGTAVPGEEMELLPHVPIPARPAEENEVQAWHQSLFWRVEGLRGREVAARTDERGRFAFEGLTAGRYDLWSRVGPLVEAQAVGVDVRAGERTEVSLRLPAACFLVGRVLAPARADFAGLRLQLLPVDWNPTIEKWPGDLGSSPVRGPLGVDGAFRLGPVPPRSYVVRLILPESGGFTSVPGPGADLDTVTLVSGDNARDFDAVATFPGALAVSVTLGGGPLTAARAVAFVLEGASGFPPMTALDADGRATFARLTPGPYALAIRPAGRSWTATAPGPFLVPAGSVAQADVDIELAAGRLLVLDAATGKPLAATRVVLSPVIQGLAPGFVTPMPATTDADGMLELELPFGDYLLHVDAGTFGAEQARSRGAPLVWSTDGPAPAEVAVGTVAEDEFVDPWRDRDKQE